MYKQAMREKLRFPTTKGNLTVEQLWDLTLNDLDSLVVGLGDQLEKSTVKTYIKRQTTASKRIKLQFDIALDVLQTLITEQDAATEAAEVKKHNEKIIAKIKAKQDAALDDLSIEELEKQLK